MIISAPLVFSMSHPSEPALSFVGLISLMVDGHNGSEGPTTVTVGVGVDVDVGVKVGVDVGVNVFV